MMNKALPYDAEVEYLESTGTQYIENVYVDAPDANEVVFAFLVNGTGDIVSNKNRSSSYENGTKIVGQNNTGAFAYYKPTGTRILLQLNNATDKSIDIVSTFSKSKKIFEIKAEGVFLHGEYSGISTNEPYSMFARNKTLPQGFFVGKIFHGKIIEDGHVVRHFVPVRVGNVGYMYEKISGQLFGNAGTGQFILGHDK